MNQDRMSEFVTICVTKYISIYTAKTYEYLATGKPIIAMAEHDSANCGTIMCRERLFSATERSFWSRFAMQIWRSKWLPLSKMWFSRRRELFGPAKHARACGDGVSEKLFLMWNDSGGYSLLERGGVCCELSS